MRRVLAAAALVVAAQSLSGQVSIDSLRALNRVGQWQSAGLLARAALGTATSVNDRCAYRESAIYSLTRLGALQMAASEMKTFDAECANSPVAHDYAKEIAQLRADHAAATRAITPDSVRRLNDRHRWLEAIRLANRGVTSDPGNEQTCAFLIELIDAHAHIGLYDDAARGFKRFDAGCAQSEVARTRSADVARMRASIADPEFPKSGFDFSAVDRFFDLVDVLSKNADPSEAQWRAYFVTPGFRFHDDGAEREMMTVAFRPSLVVVGDSIARERTGGVLVRYLRDVNARRADLQRWRDTTPLQAIAQRSATRTMAFMPAGQHPTIPLVAFGVFGDDGFSVGAEGVVLDVLHASRADLEALLAHEFHHSFDAGVTKLGPEFTNDADIPLYNAIVWLRNEGIADQIDKPYPLRDRDTSYVRRYNEAYVRTPSTLRAIDSILAGVHGDTALLRDAGFRVRNVLPFGGHPNGAYIARSIYQTFGLDSLIPALYNPFAMLRTYAAVEAKRGNPPPFSASTLDLLNSIERKHLAALEKSK